VRQHADVRRQSIGVLVTSDSVTGQVDLPECNGAVPRPSFFAVLVLVFVTAPALAQRADPPDVKVGDQWQFVEYYTVASTKPNRAWVITAVTPTGIVGTDNGEPLKLTRNMNVLESSTNRNSNPKVLNFPLEVGKRWQYSNTWFFKPKGSTGTIAVDISVQAYEKVKVPAGEFDAFRIAATEKLSGTSPINSQYAGEITRTYWYAPAARVIVKTVSRNPYLGPSTIELVAFELRQ
jgi:hypothetical protein